MLLEKNCIRMVINYAPALILLKAMCWVGDLRSSGET